MVTFLFYSIYLIFIPRSTSLLKEERTKTTIGSRGYRVAVLMGYGKPKGLEVYVHHTHLEVEEGRIPKLYTKPHEPHILILVLLDEFFREPTITMKTS